MNFNEFQEVMKEQIRDFLPEDYRDADIVIRENPKINEVYTGMVVKKEDQLIAPTVNLDVFFEQYEHGRGMNDILQDAAAVVRMEAPSVDAKKLLDYGQIRDHLFLRVCSAEKNDALLSQAPHTRMADLAVTYHIVVAEDMEVNGMASAAVTNDILRNFGITKEQLHADAVENAARMFPVKVESMDNILTAIMPEAAFFDHSERQAPGSLEDMLDACDPKGGMTVVTNSQNIHGASAIFYPEVMDKIGQAMEGDYFILPSSTHEVILLPDNGDFSWRELENLVQEVNDTQVMPAEKLSDRCYHYDVLDRAFEKSADFEDRMEQMDLDQHRERTGKMEAFRADAREQRLLREQVKAGKRIDALPNDRAGHHGAEKSGVKSVLKDLNEKAAESKSMSAPSKGRNRQTHGVAL